MDELTLLDWKRRIFDLYAAIRADRDPAHAWEQLARRCATSSSARTCSRRSRPTAARRSPACRSTRTTRRCVCRRSSRRPRASTARSRPRASTPYSFTRFARARFELGGPQTLDLYWLDGYGGGVFLSFADATSGTETYGACRYLLDTVKGADLGETNGRLILDFNFSYNPSCCYDPRWVCPLAPPGNRLAVPVRAASGSSHPAA